MAPSLFDMDRSKTFPLLLLAGVVVSFLASCATPQGPPLPEIAAEINSTLSGPVPVAVGDVITVKFTSAQLAEKWDQEVPVQPSGNCVFKGLGEVPVAGFTTASIDERLESAYGDQFPDMTGDILVVDVKVRANRTVTVMGAVEESGELVMGEGQRMTLLQALGKAGSVRLDSAYLANTLLVRWDASKQKQIYWKIDARERHWSSDDPIFLQPWDVVYIPIRPIIRANIWVDKWIRQMIPLPFVRTFPN